MDSFMTFKQLCEHIGSSPNAIGKKLGISSGSITNWKNGKLPKFETRLKIADYFKVPIQGLLTEVEKVSLEHQNEYIEAAWKDIGSAAKEFIEYTDEKIQSQQKLELQKSRSSLELVPNVKMTDDEFKLISNYRLLNDEGKNKAAENIEDMTYNPKYKKCDECKILADKT